MLSGSWLGGKLMDKFKRRRLKQSGSVLPTLKTRASRFEWAKGQSSVEFAMVSLLFFFLVFAVIDYAYIFFAQMNIQQAIDDGGRFASTGNHTTVITGGIPTTLSRLTSIEDYIQNEISIPGINVTNNLVVCDQSGSGGCSNTSGTAPAGNPGDMVTISLTTSLGFTTAMLAKLFAGGNYTFTASTTFQNEPFNPSQTN
jgi:Flp pilus assembly protein TadG